MAAPKNKKTPTAVIPRGILYPSVLSVPEPGAVLHLLNILKLENAESLAARAKLSSLLPSWATSYGGSSHLKLGDQFEFF
jgi:hypothetical protein